MNRDGCELNSIRYVTQSENIGLAGLIKLVDNDRAILSLRHIHRIKAQIIDRRFAARRG